MKPISTYAHGVMDYIGAVVLFFTPEIFGFSEVGGAAVAVPRIIGALVLLQALITDYELSVARLISMKSHLRVDYVAAVFLAASPWLFDFAGADRNVWLPHVVIGIAILAASLMTEQVPRRITAKPTQTTYRAPTSESEERRRANMP